MLVQRRSFLALMAGGAALVSAPAVLRAQPNTPDRANASNRIEKVAEIPVPKFVQPPLPFADTALAPVISQQTVQLHYGKHHAAYYANLNRLIQGTIYSDLALADVVKRSSAISGDQAILNQAGQALNHELYWAQFLPGGARVPSGALLARIDSDLGGVDTLRERLVAAASSVFGSGWAWIVQGVDGKLALVTTPNGNNPLGRNETPLLAIDVWEHAYYADYQNRRVDHVKAVLNGIVNWDVVAARLRAV